MVMMSQNHFLLNILEDVVPVAEGLNLSALRRDASRCARAPVAAAARDGGGTVGRHDHGTVGWVCARCTDAFF